VPPGTGPFDHRALRSTAGWISEVCRALTALRGATDLMFVPVRTPESDLAPPFRPLRAGSLADPAGCRPDTARLGQPWPDSAFCTLSRKRCQDSGAFTAWLMTGMKRARLLSANRRRIRTSTGQVRMVSIAL